MPTSVRVTVAGMVLLLALIPAACMVLDALAPTGPRAVVFTYVGDTALSVGQVSAVAVMVSAAGVPLPPQRLRLAITPDSTNVTLNAAGDSLIPCRAGQASLLIGLLHSSASGTAVPDTLIGLHVTGGAPPSPRCP